MQSMSLRRYGPRVHTYINQPCPHYFSQWLHACLTPKPNCASLTPGDLILTYERKMDRMAVTRELISKIVNSSHATIHNIISCSGILTITRGHSPLKSTSSMTVFYHHKWLWNLSIWFAGQQLKARASFSCKFFSSRSWFSRGPRMSFGLVVNRSQITLENFLMWIHLLNHIGGA